MRTIFTNSVGSASDLALEGLLFGIGPSGKHPGGRLQHQKHLYVSAGLRLGVTVKLNS